MKRFHKQTKQELKALAEMCRRWLPNYQELAAKLFIHIKAQEAEIEKLEADVRELRQLKFESEKRALQARLPAPALAPEARGLLPRNPLPARLKEMLAKGAQESEEWKRTLKWNSLTEEAALKLVDNYNAELSKK